MYTRGHQTRVGFARWLAPALLLAFGARSERNDPPFTLPGDPRLGGCAEVASGRVCRIDPDDNEILVWWPTPRTTDIEVLLDGKPISLNSEPTPVNDGSLAGAGMQIRASIADGNHTLQLVDHQRNRSTDWHLVPLPERPRYDPRLWCREYKDAPPSARSACHDWHIEHLRGLGEDPFALKTLAHEYFAIDRRKSASYALRATSRLRERGELSLALDAITAAVFAMRGAAEADDFAAIDAVLAVSANILKTASDHGTDYARGEARHAYVEGQVAQAKGDSIYASAWISHARALAARIGPDSLDLVNLWTEEIDMQISVGGSPDLVELDEYIRALEARVLALNARALDERDPDELRTLRCYRLAPLHINRGWIEFRLAEAGETASLTDADDHHLRGFAAYIGCRDDLQRANFQVSHLPTLIHLKRYTEAALLIPAIQRHEPDLPPDSRALVRWSLAMLDARVHDRQRGLAALDTLARTEKRAEDRWRAAITLAQEYADSDPDAATTAFRRAADLLAQAAGPSLGGARLQDPRRNGGVHVAHLLAQGHVEEAACVARESHARRTLARRWIAARSRTSVHAFADARQLRNEQSLAELADIQLSSDGKRRNAAQIHDYLAQMDRSFKLSFANVRAPRCVDLGVPAAEDTLVVIQRLPDGREAVFTLTAHGTSVAYYSTGMDPAAWTLPQELASRSDVYLLAEDPDQGAATTLTAGPRTFLSVETTGIGPSWTPHLAQLWHQPGDGLAAEDEFIALTSALTGAHWQVDVITDPLAMRDSLTRAPAPEFVHIVAHGRSQAGLTTTSGGRIRDIDFLLARAVPRVVVLGACESEQLGETLLLAGSEVVIAGRKQLPDGAASALFAGALVHDDHDLDLEALTARATDPTLWRRFKKFRGVPKR